jgi:hypothetical protein
MTEKKTAIDQVNTTNAENFRQIGLVAEKIKGATSRISATEEENNALKLEINGVKEQGRWPRVPPTEERPMTINPSLGTTPRSDGIRKSLRFDNDNDDDVCDQDDDIDIDGCDMFRGRSLNHTRGPSADAHIKKKI